MERPATVATNETPKSPKSHLACMPCPYFLLVCLAIVSWLYVLVSSRAHTTKCAQSAAIPGTYLPTYPASRHNHPFTNPYLSANLSAGACAGQTKRVWSGANSNTIVTTPVRLGTDFGLVIGSTSVSRLEVKCLLRQMGSGPVDTK